MGSFLNKERNNEKYNKRTIGTIPALGYEP